MKREGLLVQLLWETRRVRMKHWPLGMSIVEEREGFLKWEMRRVRKKPCLCDLPAVESEGLLVHLL